MKQWLPAWVARIRASIHAKLLTAFLLVVGLMLLSGVAALRVLDDVNRRAEDMVQLQRKIAAFRQLNHDTIGQLYMVTSSLLNPDERAMETALRQLNHFGYDLDRLQFVAQDERELLTRVRQDYEQFIAIVSEVMALIRDGRAEDGRRLQLERASPLADRLERLTNELVNKAESDMVASTDSAREAFESSRRLVVAVAVGCVLLSLLLGYVISSSLVRPVKSMERRLRELTKSQFGGHVEVINRDELGNLAADLNHMSQELGRLYAQLESASRHKSEFLANMSHELRTPLNAILGFSEMMNTPLFGQLNDKHSEYARLINASGRHLLSLINDILDLAKVEAGRMDLQVGNFDLRTLIGDTLLLVRERAGQRGIILSADIEVPVGAFRGDERRIKQILLNLLSNAVKFTPQGGNVTVTARANDGGVEVAVRDTGEGIPKDKQSLLFQAFQQLEPKDGAKREGTGLGLALARSLTEMHGGSIWVESDTGRGATFTFTLKEQ